ncbi:MAG: class I SAM-dependent methyltransferase [Roseburia sp. 1XD42-69]|jgi:Protein-L-isoaspartate carboxylmethyltransferase
MKEDSKRIYGKVSTINTDEVKQLYAERSGRSKTVHVDSPVVLSGDVDVENIELWTSWELKKWFPQLLLNEDSTVFELGFGTGRMTKYIVPLVKQYVGIDYVEEFVKIAQERDDIQRKENAIFLNADFKSFLDNRRQMELPEFTHFFLSGGVFMYMNDDVVEECIEKMEGMLAKNSKIYLSEPIALLERLTLDSFYSESLSHNYSAIYRTEEEYKNMFQPLFDKGFQLKVSELFFENDIKKQKETQQWMFIMER